MRLVEVRDAVNRQMDVLSAHRSKLQDMMKHQLGDRDRLELSRELETVDAAYEEASRQRDKLNELDAAVQNAETARRQAEAEAEAQKEQLKILEIFRRIAAGDRVPAYDEQKLMEYDSKMYMAARTMSVLQMDRQPEDHRSLWADEEEEQEFPDPGELADRLELPELPPLPELPKLDIQA